MAFNKGKGVEPALTYCVNPEVLQQFVEFIMKKKKKVFKPLLIAGMCRR